MRRTLFLILIPLGFLILTGGTTLPSDSEPEGQDSVVTTSDKIKAARLNIKLISTNPVQEAVEWYNDLFFQTNFEARVQRVQRDRIGYTHIRLKQYYKGIPIDGTDVIVHINKDSVIYWVTGDMLRRLDMDVEPTLSAAEAERIALEDAVSTRCFDAECSETRDAYDEELDLYYGVAGRERGLINVSEEATLFLYGTTLLYRLVVAEHGEDNADWEYWIDAHTGDVRRRHNTIAHYSSKPPSDQGYDTAVTGCLLPPEVDSATMDSIVSIQGWRDTVGDMNYFLYSKGSPASGIGPWGLFDLNGNSSMADTASDSLCRWEQKSSSDWGTEDRQAVSVGQGFERVQHWLADTLGRYSVDSAGLLLRGAIHWGYTRPGASFRRSDSTIYFSNDEDDTMYLSGHLQTVAHEAGHALTRFTSDIKHAPAEAGGVNESYSDIMGAAIEFVYQPDSSGAYPASPRGCADWLVGEDAMKWDHFLAIRDFRLPNREREGGDNADVFYNYGTYYESTNFWNSKTSPPWSAYHMMGVQNYAFYLLAEGCSVTDTNEGHTCGAFRGIGRHAAVRVAMQANIYHSTEHTNFTDSRLAWVLAAQELADEGTVPAFAATVAESAWIAVGVVPELRVRYADATKLQIGQVGSLKLHSDAVASSLDGLIFTHSTSGKGASVGAASTFRFKYSTSLTPNSSDYLDTASFAGGLVVRGPGGVAQFAIDSSGVVRLREQLRENSLW